MKIGIDARLFGAEKNRGLGRYVSEFLYALEKIANPTDTFYIFLKKENFPLYQPKAKNFLKRIWDVPWYTLKEQVFWQPLLREPLDLYHFPHWNVPYFFPKPFILTVHDLIILEEPRARGTTLNKWHYLIKFFSLKILLQKVFKKAQKIIAVSQTTAQSLQRLYPQTQNKTIVIYEGIVTFPYPSLNERKNNQINRPFLLYVGSAYPHKNLEFLIQNFLEFNHERKLQLVLVGRFDYFYQKLFEEHKKSSAFSQALQNKDIIFWGEGSDEDLSWLYQKTICLICPSLIEGFALPALEALACQTPVLVSDIPIFREILGNLAYFFDPKNPKDFQNKLRNLLQDLKLKDKIKEALPVLEKKFNWENCAKQTLALYHEVYGTGKK